jgi:hypothetical protein
VRRTTTTTTSLLINQKKRGRAKAAFLEFDDMKTGGNAFRSTTNKQTNKQTNNNSCKDACCRWIQGGGKRIIKLVYLINDKTRN